MNLKQKKGMRDAFGEAVLDLAKNNKKILALSADLSPSVRLGDFKLQYPDQFIEVGVAEQNMAGIAAGLALEGFIPFITSFAVFNPGRNWEQIRNSICYQDANVKIIGSHAGLNVGEDGATHQALEDFAITRCLPNIKVISPADANECYQATKAMALIKGPVYMRFPRIDTPVFSSLKKDFEIGKIDEIKKGTDLTIIATGHLVFEALEVAKELEKENKNIRVLNCSTIKPIDKEIIIKAAKETRAIVTLEDHQVIGGLGSAVAEIVAENYPVPIKRIGINDVFGESGNWQDLYKKYGLNNLEIKETIKKFYEKK